MGNEVIICLVGKSGVGKTSIAKELEGRYNVIKSFTDRNPRFPKEWGHIFVDKNFGIPYHDIVAFTNFHGHRYWTTKSQFKNKGISIYVVDYKGIEYLRKKMLGSEIVILYLQCNFLKRISRLFKRDKLKAIGRLWNDRKEFKDIMYDYKINTDGNIYDSAIKIESLITRKFWGLRK